MEERKIIAVIIFIIMIIIIGDFRNAILDRDQEYVNARIQKEYEKHQCNTAINAKIISKDGGRIAIERKDGYKVAITGYVEMDNDAVLTRYEKFHICNNRNDAYDYEWCEVGDHVNIVYSKKVPQRGCTVKAVCFEIVK